MVLFQNNNTTACSITVLPTFCFFLVHIFQPVISKLPQVALAALDFQYLYLSVKKGYKGKS